MSPGAAASGSASKYGPPASVASHTCSPSPVARMNAKRSPPGAHTGARSAPCSGPSAHRTVRSARSIAISRSTARPAAPSRRSEVRISRAPGRHAAGAAARVGTRTVRPSATLTTRKPPSTGDTNATHAPSSDQRGSKPITSCSMSGHRSPVAGSSSQGRGGNGSRRLEKTMVSPSGAHRAALHSAPPQPSNSRRPPAESTSQRSAANTSVPSVTTREPPSGDWWKSRTDRSNDARVRSSPASVLPSFVSRTRAAIRARSAAPSAT